MTGVILSYLRYNSFMLQDIYKILDIPETYWEEFTQKYQEMVMRNLITEVAIDLPEDQKTAFVNFINTSSDPAVDFVKWLSDHNSELVGKDEAIKKSFIETTGSFVEALWGDANDDTRQQILSVLKKGINV